MQEQPTLTFDVDWSEQVECPKCETELDVIETSYGWRAICVGCGIRWTHVNGEKGMVAERHSPMAENLRRR